ncbi:MAG: hypothetical protein ACKVP0_02025 [Pirellulaceae bacterium]
MAKADERNRAEQSTPALSSSQAIAKPTQAQSRHTTKSPDQEPNSAKPGRVRSIYLAGCILYFLLCTGYDTIRYWQRYNAVTPGAVVRISVKNLVMAAVWPIGILVRINEADFERRNPPVVRDRSPERAASQTLPVDQNLDTLTAGMIVGRAQDDDVYDIAFPGDMMPDVDVISLNGKSAQIVYGIRIAKNTPIMMLKLVHFSTTMPLGVQEVTATSSTHTATHKFPPNMISRQTVSGGTLEFATLLPYVEDSAGRFLRVTSDSDAYNVEVKGANGFTTFSPGKTAREHASQMLVLFSALEQRPDFVATLQRNALSVAEFQTALLQSQ